MLYIANMDKQEEFIYWLDGVLTDKTELNAAQTKLLTDKLGQAFNKVTPDLTNVQENLELPDLIPKGLICGQQNNSYTDATGIKENKIVINQEISC